MSDRVAGLTLGVIGGMGPLATAEFMRRVVEASPSKTDQGHFRIVVDSDPSIPDRTLALLGQGNDPGKAIVRTAKSLVRSGADILALPCMTAHAWFDVIAKAVVCPVLNMARASMLRAQRMGHRVVGVLATEGTLRAQVLERAVLETNAAVELIRPDLSAQSDIGATIRAIKGGDVSSAVMQINRAGEAMVERGCDGLLLACTELSLLRGRVDHRLPWIDALDSLAISAVNACFGLPDYDSVVGMRDSR